jgi:LPS-assembly protein
MLRTALSPLLVLIALTAIPRPASAQQPPGGCKIWQTNSQQSITITSTRHYRLIHNVEVDCNDMQFFADEVEIFSDADRMRASGNVVFVSSTNRIAAERMDFNTRTRTGTFYIASGIASMETRGIERSLFGGQEPDAYFWGETIEKLGPKTYRVTRGGFTTCVQPTPRWELVSNSATVTLEEHAVLKNTIFKVKGVPLFYLPAMYYPINKEDRATGFLIPTYGSSSIRGQTLSNAFFWAIDRSQDATLYHDYYSKTGQGFGSEYRYVEGPGSQGTGRFQVIDEHDATYETNGVETVHPGSSSYSFSGNMSQRLSTHMRATANADYFSSVSAQQRYQQNIFQMTSRTRRLNVNLSGNWGRYSISTTVDRTQTFSADDIWNLYGSAPRITITRAEAPIGHLPIYFGANGEYVTLVRSDKSGVNESDHGLTRIDFYPVLRFPFTRWSFLTFNSTFLWRGTYWSESQDPLSLQQLNEPIGRTYFDMSTRITGPVFTRIFNRPNSAYAQKFKHVIEPTLTLQRVTPIDNYNQIVKIDGTDTVVGQVTRVSYGLNNRLYAKHDVAREILTLSISQTYYTDARAASVDPSYQSGYNALLPPSHLSPVVILVHASPATRFDATFRTEYDTQVHALRTLAANGVWNGARWIVATAGWSQRRFIPNLSGYNNPLQATNYLSAGTTVKSPANSFGTTYTFNYDLRHDQFLQQRVMGYYNSQCCGFAVEYQSVNYQAAFTAIGVTQDHRFNISFTLAGIGSFSNLLGAFGGQQVR